MSKNALVIINPYAGQRKSRKNMFEIVDRLSRSNYAVSVQTTSQPGDGAAIIRQYGALMDLVVCCGGDGTLNEVINGLLENHLDVALGYVPAGSTNDFARTLRLPKKVEDCMDRIINGHPHPYDMGRFNDRNFTYIASLGAFTKVSYSTPQKLKNTIGHTAYILEGVKEIGNITPFKAKVEANGKTYSGEFLFGSVSNSTSIAGLFRLNSLDVRLDDGELELMLVRNPENATALTRIINGLTSNNYDPDYVIFTHIKEMKIHTEEPVGWTLDGESGGEQTDVQISVLHNSIRLIV